MGIYSHQIVPRITHLTMRSGPIREIRKKAIASARCVVLDVGFGSGLNVNTSFCFVRSARIQSTWTSNRRVDPTENSVRYFEASFSGTGVNATPS